MNLTPDLLSNKNHWHFSHFHNHWHFSHFQETYSLSDMIPLITCLWSFIKWPVCSVFLSSCRPFCSEKCHCYLFQLHSPQDMGVPQRPQGEASTPANFFKSVTKDSHCAHSQKNSTIVNACYVRVLGYYLILYVKHFFCNNYLIVTKKV